MQELKDTIGIELKIFLGENEEGHLHQEVELLYVMEGSLKLIVGEQEYRMQAEDVVAVNSNKHHAYRSEPDCLFCRIHISYQTISDVIGTPLLLFWCNSTMEKGESYREFRKLLHELTNDHVNGRKGGNFYSYSLYYRLLHFLTTYYQIAKEDFYREEQEGKQEARLSEIISYVHGNYNRPISLQELADHLYLTKSYLSKYIKKNLGMNFLNYLNNIRIHHAMDDLIHTEHSITRIALDNGFTNTTVFNRLFKEYYQDVPSAYRQKMKYLKTDEISGEKKKQLQDRLEQYFMTGALVKKEAETSDVTDITADYREGEPYTPCWNQIINAGSAVDMMSYNLREHLLLAQRELGIRYIRFWDIFSQDMYFVGDIEKDEFNFGKLDNILDFLIENRMLPFIELGEKPRRIQRTVSDFIVSPDNRTVFQSYEERLRGLEALMEHLLGHYGEKQVSQWKFEIWDDRREETAQNRQPYNRLFQDTRDIIKKYIPKAQVGGAGRHLGWFHSHTVEGIRQWIDEGIYPDFLTYSYFPYSAGEFNREIYSKRKTDEDNLRITLEELQEELAKSGFPTREIYITDWNGTISDRNFTNDSCWKAAWMMKSYFDAVGKVDALAYNCLSDCISQHYDTQGILNGCRGALSKDGIEKPSFHAMRFMGLLSPWMIQKGKDYMITTDRSQKIAVACHNFKERNYLYYLKPENEMGPEDQYRFFDDQDGKKVRFRLHQLPNGWYLQKTYVFNREHGSVLDEWMKMECMKNLRRDEEEYLKRASIPEITLQKFEVTDGSIEREWYLQAHEIRVVQFIRIVTMPERTA